MSDTLQTDHSAKFTRCPPSTVQRPPASALWRRRSGVQPTAIALSLVIALSATTALAAGPRDDGLPMDTKTGPQSSLLAGMGGRGPAVGALTLLLEVAESEQRKAPAGAPRCLPFQEGEVLEYVLEWMGIDVGRATFRVLPSGRFGKRAAWHFQMSASTTSWADKIYRVRDRLDAWADVALSRAIGHEKIAREGSYHRDIRLALDWQRKRVTYRNQWKAFPSQPLFDDTWDPLGLLYAFRREPLTGKGTRKMSVTDGLKTIRADLKVHGRETIEVGGKKVKAWRVEPEMKDVGGIFERSPGARMEVWVSDDGRHLPIRLRSAVIVGSFTATLVRASGLAPDRPGCRLDSPSADNHLR